MRKHLKTFVGIAAAILACGAALAQEQSKPAPNSPAPAGQQAAPVEPLVGGEPWTLGSKGCEPLPGVDGRAGPGNRASGLNITYDGGPNDLGAIETMDPRNGKDESDLWGIYSSLVYDRLADTTHAGSSGATGEQATADNAAPAGEQAAPAAPLIGDEPWEIRLKFYGWLPSIDGRAGLGKNGSPVNVTYGDLLSNLDTLQSLVPLDLEARLGHWGVYSDVLYLRAVTSTTVGPRGGVKVGVAGQQTIWEIGGFYRVGTWAVNPHWGNSISVDAIGGVRYNNLGGTIGVETRRHAVSVGGEKEWWDPFVGPRVIWNLDEQFSLFARGDVGGFGIEDSSNFVWQFIGGGDWNICKYCFLEAGYRMLSTDYETGTGFRHFTYDTRMGGPYIALGVKF